MNFDGKFRFHMGCGEPLQSRSWLKRTLRLRLSADNDGKIKCARAGLTPSRRGAKCKL